MIEWYLEVQEGPEVTWH